MPFSATKMNLDKCHMLSFICRILFFFLKNVQINLFSKQKETYIYKNKLMATKREM